MTLLLIESETLLSEKAASSCPKQGCARVKSMRDSLLSTAMWQRGVPKHYDSEKKNKSGQCGKKMTCLKVLETQNCLFGTTWEFL